MYNFTPSGLFPVKSIFEEMNYEEEITLFNFGCCYGDDDLLWIYTGGGSFAGGSFAAGRVVALQR